MKCSKICFCFLIIALGAASQACSTSRGNLLSAADLATETQPFSIESSASSITPTIAAQNPAPTATPAVELAQSPTPPAVTITAVNGNLAIRNGPDPVFDAISVLKNGDTLPALARSVLDGWVEVPLPDQSGKTGWVSTKTPYSVVSGNVLNLPKIMTVEWPTGSYIQNCTNHRMLVEPTNRRLSPVGDSSTNRAWFPPGLYTVYDLDMAGEPYVMNIKLMAHTEVNIHKNGNRQWWNCP